MVAKTRQSVASLTPKASCPAGQPIEQRDPAHLKQHPRQAELFSDLPDHELRLLAESIEARGLDHAIEILPDGTIVAGHQRRRACQLLNWSTVPVIIRQDLAEAGPEAVEQHLIADNLDRRQLSKLDIARCYVELKELQKQQSRGPKGQRQGDVRDLLAKRLGVSGRMLDRYAAVLQTPMAVQQAVSAGTLSVQAGEKISRLPKTQQQQFVAAIENGIPPKAAAARFLQKDDPSPVQNRIIHDLASLLKRARAELADRLGEIDHDPATEAHLTELRAGQDFLGLLIGRLAGGPEADCSVED